MLQKLLFDKNLISFWVLHLLIINCNSQSHLKAENSVIDYVANSTARKLHVYQTVLILKLPLLERVSTRYVEKLIAIQPSVVINVTNSNISSNEIRKHMENPNFSVSFRTTLSVIIVENDQKTTTIQELTEYLNFMINLASNNIRPRCLVFLVGRTNTSLLKDFFRLSWASKFLDITIIEVNPKSQKHTLNLAPEIVSNATVHQYNPFNDEYTRESLSPMTNLFPNKLINLHGYPLTTGFYENTYKIMIDDDYTGEDLYRKISGSDISFLRTVSKTLNFRAKFKVYNPLYRYCNMSQFNLLEEDDLDALTKGTVDFGANTYIALAVDPMRESSVSLAQANKNIIVRQYGRNRIKVSKVLVVAVTFAVGLCLILVYLTYFNRNIWTMYNALHILVMGFSPTSVPRRTIERLFFLYLVIVSSWFSVYILEDFLDLFYGISYLSLKTIKDLVDNNIVPIVPPDLVEILAKYAAIDDTYAQKILAAQTKNTSMKQFDCLRYLVDDSSSKVTGCTVDSTFGKLLVDSHSSGTDGWILTFVDEPIVLAWTVMSFAKTSPYVRRFNEVLHRCHEGGLMNVWQKLYIRYYMKMQKHLFPYGNVMRDETWIRRYDEVKSSLVIRNLMVLQMACYLFCVVIFVCELGIRRWRCKAACRKIHKSILQY